MKFTAEREAFLMTLQTVMGVVERRQTMPVLANVLIVCKENGLALTATDLEVELQANGTATVLESGEITVPGRKLLDIVRALPDKSAITFATEAERAVIRAGKSRFALATLPAPEFPTIESIDAGQHVQLPQAELKRLIEKTHFSMAQQDVRYYLNGMLLELSTSELRVVATDGHRLALASASLAEAVPSDRQVILPRKGALELQRILGTEGDVQLAIGQNHLQIQLNGVRFTSKLIDGRFPEYGRVIPADPPQLVTADRNLLRAALQRAAILSNEKYRGIRLTLQPNLMVLQAHNPEQEEAEEEVDVQHQGASLEIGFNVNYLLDALAAVDGEHVQLGFTDGNSSCLIQRPDVTNSKYVVMPMRL